MGLALLTGDEADPGLQCPFDQVQPLFQLDIGSLTLDVPGKRQGDEPLPLNGAQPLCGSVNYRAIPFRDRRWIKC